MYLLSESPLKEENQKNEEKIHSDTFDLVDIVRLTRNLQSDEVLNDRPREIWVFWSTLQTLVVFWDCGRVAKSGNGGVTIHWDLMEKFHLKITRNNRYIVSVWKIKVFLVTSLKYLNWKVSGELCCLIYRYASGGLNQIWWNFIWIKICG